jgi:DNA/RNA-binding domain of Phe-tRNA-synthetase-like protein
VSFEASVGWCEAQVQEELPHLRIALQPVELPRHVAPSRPSPESVRQRLAALSDRFNGAKAVNLRREPVTAAYRVFFRHIGLDPDAVRTPVEAAVLERMLDGGFLSRCLLADVLLIALLDTGVPVWALDAERIEGEVGVRTSRAGETLGGLADALGYGGSGEASVAQGDGQPVDAGQLVVADARCALAMLFSDPASAYRPSGRTRRLLLYTLQVGGVPWLTIEESLWICRSALEAVA